MMAHCQLGAVGKVDAGLLATEVMQQQVRRQQQAGQQAHKSTVARQLTKAVPVLVSDAIKPEVLEVFVGRDVEQHHDESISPRQSLPRLLRWPLEGSNW